MHENPVESVQPRSWMSLHLATWATASAMAVMLIYFQFDGRLGYINGGAWRLTRHLTYGWPFAAVLRQETRTSSSVRLSTGKFRYESVNTYQSNIRRLIVNLLVCGAMTASTLLATEKFCRRSSRFRQISLFSMLMLTTIAALLLVIYQHEYFIVGGVFDGLTLSSYQGLKSLPWYFAAPALFGLGCTLYAFGVVIWWIVQRSLAMIYRPGPVG